MANPTFAGTALPDCFVGVPYLVGLPVVYQSSGTITALTAGGTVLGGALPQGIALGTNGIVSGTVQVTSATGSQVDGAYSFGLLLKDGATGTASSVITMNVHYLTNEQDLTTAAQAALRDAEVIDNTSAADEADFPADSLPQDIG